ncbi:hypothetical protein NEOKW01_1313 [Nematocida sp. AWRm80]|nr:hypothetical protein NEOKW01_1313 [Nematocida sp. AWRm80]
MNRKIPFRKKSTYEYLQYRRTLEKEDDHRMRLSFLVDMASMSAEHLEQVRNNIKVPSYTMPIRITNYQPRIVKMTSDECYKHFNHMVYRFAKNTNSGWYIPPTATYRTVSGMQVKEKPMYLTYTNEMKRPLNKKPSITRNNCSY